MVVTIQQIHIQQEYSMLYNCILFVLIIVTWGYNCLLRIIIVSYLKSYDYVQKITINE